MGVVILTEDAIREEIEQLAVKSVAPGLVALALALASAIDAADGPSAVAVAARELRATMSELRKLAPPAVKGDALDELASRRADRRGA